MRVASAIIEKYDRRSETAHDHFDLSALLDLMIAN